MTHNAQTSSDERSFPFHKFLPGLILGVVVGAFAGAFVPPVAHAWATLPPDPVPHGPRLDDGVNPTRSASSPAQADQDHPVASVSEGR